MLFWKVKEIERSGVKSRVRFHADPQPFSALTILPRVPVAGYSSLGPMDLFHEDLAFHGSLVLRYCINWQVRPDLDLWTCLLLN